MCRLLGCAAPDPTTVEQMLGFDQQRVFADMAALHRDGWGSAWRDGSGALHALRHAGSGLGDPGLQASLADAPATARIVHLRLATGGFACSEENTHPFVADGMAFAHNGSLEPAGPIDELIGPEQAAQLRGDTDTERYFAAVRTAIAHGRSPFDALVETVSALRAIFPDRSLNALLLTDDELLAVHASEGVPIPHHVFAASGIPTPQLPRNHVDAYYLMRMRRGVDGSVLFASSGLDIGGWDPLPAESVTRVDLSTLTVETRPLARLSKRRLVA